VTGGAGFIGSSFIRWGLLHFKDIERIVNLDLLTYAGSELNMSSFAADPRHQFVKGDIQDGTLVKRLCEENQIEAIVHFAAESHVDRSITQPSIFLETNILGTFSLLQVIRQIPHIHFHHISTDEVYGSLEEGFFNEMSPYRPTSPYAASKAASDHLVKAWAHTYHLSYTLSHCSNNYGPYQHVEKFIPRMIHRYIKGETFTLYGSGHQVRDWLYVDDHAEAVWTILNQGQAGEVYDIGGGCERRNIDLLHHLLSLIAQKTSQSKHDLEKRIVFCNDRPDDDLRYAIDTTKMSQTLGWKPRFSLEKGLEETVNWYLHHFSWSVS
jgi:dTDP-glucose 4,6-dehydratase